MRNKALLFSAVAAALLAGCSSGGDTPEAAQAQPSNFRLTAAQRQHIRIETVAPASFRPTIVAPGTVDYDNDQATVVTSQFTGPLTRLLVALGQHVAKGQPIALVQSADYATAVGTFQKAVVTAANARRIANADRDLAAHNGISAREAAQAQTDAASAEADREAARQALAALGVDPRAVPVQAGRAPAGAIIRAPIAGTVVDRPVTPGQLLQGGTTALLTIANLSRVWVLAQVPNSDVAAVRLGDPAQVDAGAGIGTFHGTVDNISASVDPNSRAVIARIVLANPGALLKRQMYVDVSIRSSRSSTGLTVPVSAVLRDDENLPFVYLALPDGSFARRHVTLGNREGENYEIGGGLAAGDKIVVDGALFLQFMQSQ
ncbi:MAG TPA: efflux RND transporter periplasmic adaptor subunit [Allosphingosinicella sp.]|jgi:cobalt-zinc-cadmium efflux system membrane fusion protein|nr:efflux RND transporter periplasmic adaptor subunit [Allosphingosinicella sp.]